MNDVVKSVICNFLEMFGSVDDQFIGIVDELVILSETDRDLADGIRWIDSQSQKNGITFYEMALMVLRKHLAEKRAKEWLEKRIS